MAENKLEPKDISPMKKAMLWGSIKMKTLFDDSQNQAAEMMINGTVMGINELTAMKNENENLTDEVSSFIDEILTLEEEYEQRLKKFL
jgi:DNA-binding ferritin-like protein (Dps family)